MPKNILIDAGFWIALYTERDQWHQDATLYDEYLTVHKLILPWPSFYEFLNTRFAGNQSGMLSFRKRILQPNVVRLLDSPYREPALTKFLELTRTGRRLSLVDLVMREILSDESAKIDAMVTFNESDFADLCALRRIEFFNG